VRDISGADISWISDPDHANLINELIGVEATWGNDDPHYANVWGWKPYPIGAFGAMLDKAVSLKGREGLLPNKISYLEIGCGIGTKLVLAYKVFGIGDVNGFDIDEPMVTAAAELITEDSLEGDISLWVDDAREYERYGDFDIVWFNRCLRDQDEAHELETKVFSAMKTGSILLLGNSLTIPQGWIPLGNTIMLTMWQKACKCTGAEEYLEYPRESEFDIVKLHCKACGREVVFA
jgi:SAM-dependent methyltransferase